MHIDLNETHDPALTSWVDSANGDTDFPIQNLPFGVFDEGRARGGVALGEYIIDLAALCATSRLSGAALEAARAGAGDRLEPLLAQDPASVSALRASLSALFRAGAEPIEGVLVPQANVTMRMPVKPTAFTDFCTSIDHIRRMGAASGAPPKLAWSQLPVAYNGRASSVAISGTPVRRPVGQFESPPRSNEVVFGPEPMLDFELEFGVWLGRSTTLGETISVADAEARMFGCCLINDWSARAIQFFEAMLGPHLGKSFLTTISPWIVTMEALAPFRVAARGRAEGEPEVPAHLFDADDRARGALSIALTAHWTTAEGQSKQIVRTEAAELYWTLAQMIAHQASGGAPLEAGDLVASGTVSGGADEARACLVEITALGRDPVVFPDGSTRTMLGDGDTLTLRGRAQAPGYRAIGFGDCAGTVQPAAVH